MISSFHSNDSGLTCRALGACCASGPSLCCVPIFTTTVKTETPTQLHRRGDRRGSRAVRLRERQRSEADGTQSTRAEEEEAGLVLASKPPRSQRSFAKRQHLSDGFTPEVYPLGV